MQTLLAVTAALFIIIVAAQVCGRVATRVGQPAVVGEMVSGILLGPTVLGALAPGFSGYVFSESTKPTLYVIAMVGLSLYMFLVGLEHEHHPSSRKDAVLPIVLAVAGLVFPLLAGGAAALYLEGDFRPEGVDLPLFVLFVGGALSVTAFPMLARVLQERRMMQTDFGGVATRAAAVDDAMAWCILAVVGALAVHGNWLGSWRTIVPAAVFAVAAFVLLPRIFRKPMQRAVHAGQIDDRLLVTLLALVLAAGWFTDYIGIYSVFGGFICGMALPKVRGFSELLNGRVMQVVRCLFLPTFFAFSGLNTDLTSAFNADYLLAFAVVFVAAFASKAIASLSVLRAFRWSWGESIAMGGLMNARGLMILIFINIGLALGVIETQLFSILVLIAVLTTALAVPAYRVHFTADREQAARESWAVRRFPDDYRGDLLNPPEMAAKK
ncbi:Kef-type K+ transport system, membrane component KefB [Promicromonospora umidemergens]|uniref:Cation:proton antiporter n=1 Tax=Promicromonospora umidemergens TaxID=629679 RepID=A0ABP8WEW5_9MICO|nr:cation:proton antiporter [Promicromonospora umidemergens]MCP2284140.1 Kef-type K+ transport system, membrane component KefB [Promicromonospora umidemergens]